MRVSNSVHLNFWFIFTFVYLFIPNVQSQSVDLHGYLNYDSLKLYLEDLEKANPDILKLFSLGISPQGRELWALHITARLWEGDHKKPVVKLDGSLYGDDSVGRQLLLKLATYLVQNYGKEEVATRIINNTNLYIVPSYDPDGFENASKSCDVPLMFKSNVIYKETREITEWLKNNEFDLSVSFMGGGLMVLESSDELKSDADKELLTKLAQNYKSNNKKMSSNITCESQKFPSFSNFTHRIHKKTDALKLDIFIYCCKYPDENELQWLWNDNKKAIISLIQQTRAGLQGRVVHGVTHLPVDGVVVSLGGRNCTTDKNGAFLRLLPPGIYKVLVVAAGFEILQRNIFVDKEATKVELILHSKENVLEGEINEIMEVVDNLDVSRNLVDDTSELRHMSHEEMEEFLNETVSQCSHIMKLYSIGTSVRGRVLWVVEVSDRPGVHETGEPEFKYIGNMHGNEVVGRVLLLNLLRILCLNYNKSRFVTLLVNNTRIHVLPTMNPDGYAVASEGDNEGVDGRTNADQVDLNRNFPDQFSKDVSNEVLALETSSVMNWCRSFPFVLSANLHGGAILANYPFDNSPSGKDVYSKSPDDETFKMLASSYSRAHTNMSQGNLCSDHFKGGVTNGANWYSVTGGMQDWNYLNTNSFEITLELSCVKYPKADQLYEYWFDNRQSLLVYIAQVHKGVRGYVTDCQSGLPIEGASIFVGGVLHAVTSTKNGEYWRILPPGKFEITVAKDNFASQIKKVNVYKNHPSFESFCLEYFGPLSWHRNWSVIFDYNLEDNLRGRYSDLDDISSQVSSIVSKLPRFVELVSIGREGKLLRIVDITDSTSSDDKLNILLIGRLKDYEPIGTEVLMNTIRWFAAAINSSNAEVLKMLKSLNLHILPILKMEGFQLPTAEICTNNVDDDFKDESKDEMDMLMEYLENNRMDIIISFESGFVGTRYFKTDISSPTCEMFTNLFTKNLFSTSCPEKKPFFTRNSFHDHIRRVYEDIFVMSVGVHCCTSPESSELKKIWTELSTPIKDVILSSSRGVVMQIRWNGTTNFPVRAVLLPHNHHFILPSNETYYLPLPPGVYSVSIERDTKLFEVKDGFVRIVFDIDSNTTSDSFFYSQLEHRINKVGEFCPGLLHFTERTNQLDTTLVSLGHLSPISFKFGLLGGFHGDDLGQALLWKLMEDACKSVKNDLKLQKFFSLAEIEILFVKNRPSTNHTQHNFKDDELESTVVSWVDKSNLSILISLQQGNLALVYPSADDSSNIVDVNKYFARLYQTNFLHIPQESSKCRNKEFELIDGKSFRRQNVFTLSRVSKTTRVIILDVYMGFCGRPGVNSQEFNLQMDVNFNALIGFLLELPTGVQGYVKDENNFPVEDVKVTFKELPLKVATNNSGFFQILLPPGNYTLTFEARSFQNLTRIINVSIEVVHVTINLKMTSRHQFLVIILITCLITVAIILLFLCWKFYIKKFPQKWQPIKQDDYDDDDDDDDFPQKLNRVKYHKNSDCVDIS